jgi:hypothetical protein
MTKSPEELLAMQFGGAKVAGIPVKRGAAVAYFFANCSPGNSRKSSASQAGPFGAGT